MANNIDWLKLVTRKTSLAFMHAVAGQEAYFKKFVDFTVAHYWFNGITYEAAYARDEVLGLGQYIAEEIEKDFKFARQNEALCVKICLKLTQEAEKLQQVDFAESSPDELADTLENLLLPFYDLIPFLLIPHSIERYILAEVKKEIEARVENEDKREGYLKIFTTPLEEDTEERESALELAEYVQKNGWDNEAKKRLEKHTENFCWIPMWGVNYEPLTEEYFKEEIDTLVESLDQPLATLDKLERDSELRKQEVKRALAEVGAGKYLESLVYILQAYIYLRTHRKNAFSKANYYQLPLLFEVAKRMKVTEDEVKVLTYEEILAFLRQDEMVSQNIIKKRLDGWGVIGLPGKRKVFSGTEEVKLAIFQYGTFFQKINEEQIKGQIANTGRMQGKVKIVMNTQDLKKVEKGDVLVAIMTTPDFMTAIHKCSAIVTDEGGVTSHAAIISRELNIPCIIGTGNATSTLQDGDIVEVDAEEGVVRKL